MDPVTIAKIIGVRRLVKILGAMILASLLFWVILLPLLMGVVAGGSVDEEDAAAASCTGTSSGGVVQAGNTPGPGPGLGRWDAEAIANAGVIAQRGIAAGVGAQGVVVALATAMQESGNLHSLDYGHADSLGLFQQRPAAGWGTPAQIMDPALSSDAFYGVAQHTANPGLTDIAGWQSMTVAQAAQAVQRSAFPEAYAKWENEARTLASAVLEGVDLTQIMCTGAGAVISGDWAHPLAPAAYTNTSPFGMRFHPISGTWKLHDGTDLAGPIGTPLRSVCNGTITQAGFRGTGGLTTTIDCGGGIEVLYRHQNKVSITVGQVVKAGAVIGELGNTGGSTGPHLHFVVRVAGTAVDPIPFMATHGIRI